MPRCSVRILSCIIFSKSTHSFLFHEGLCTLCTHVYVKSSAVCVISSMCILIHTFSLPRFLTVSPSSPDDLSLLATVLEVLQTLTLVSLPRPLQPGMPDYLMQRGGLEWLCGVTCTGEAMCVKLLKEYVDNAHQKKLSSPHR